MHRMMDSKEKMLVADTEADIAELPTDLEPGATCLVAEGSKVYILTPARQWVEI